MSECCLCPDPQGNSGAGLLEQACWLRGEGCVSGCVCVCWRRICISLTRQLHQTRVILCGGRKPQRASQLGWNAQPHVGSMGELHCDFCSSMESEERGASAEKKIHQGDGEQGVLLSTPRHHLRCAPLLTFLAHICAFMFLSAV